jgi:hypothetical protein
VAAEKDRDPEAKAETKTEAGTSSQWAPNRIVGFLNQTIWFFSFRTEEALEDYCARDCSGTSLVSSRPHA